ncbi:MAG: hypothetical protein JWN48_1198, partial [Myxococcaceae bacterium]|nr:hypothetical protein [Myxococcaceae bacterium]
MATSLTRAVAVCAFFAWTTFAGRAAVVLLGSEDGEREATLAELTFLHRELRAGAAARMQQLFPEGYVFMYALYGLTWTALAQSTPELRERAWSEASWAVRQLDAPAALMGATSEQKTFDERFPIGHPDQPLNEFDSRTSLVIGFGGVYDFRQDLSWGSA